MPFLPQQGPGTDKSVSGSNAAHTALAPVPVPSLLNEDRTALNNGPMAGLSPVMGLFRGQFTQAGGNPAFVNREHRVEGPCEGAGLRYARSVCPDCQLLGEDAATGNNMVMWTEGPENEGVFHAVSRDCITTAPDGASVVGSLEFGGSAVVGGADATFADGLVPLVPGAERLAAFEIGGWLATLDEVVKPATAMADMNRMLVQRGWREAKGQEAIAAVETLGQRVFTNDANALCVVTLNEEGGKYQLMTILSS
jgi:hypothetical protein